MRGLGPRMSHVLRREVDRDAKALIRPFGAPSPGGEGKRLRLVGEAMEIRAWRQDFRSSVLQFNESHGVKTSRKSIIGLAFRFAGE